MQEHQGGSPIGPLTHDDATNILNCGFSHDVLSHCDVRYTAYHLVVKMSNWSIVASVTPYVDGPDGVSRN